MFYIIIVFKYNILGKYFITSSEPQMFNRYDLNVYHFQSFNKMFLQIKKKKNLYHVKSV